MLRLVLKHILNLSFAVAVFATGATAAVESGSNGGAQERLNHLARQGIAKNYLGSRIELTTPVRWVYGQMPEEISDVRILGENLPGEVRISALGTDGSASEGVVGFAAWTPVRVAVKRIQPGEKLSPEMFVIRDVNVAMGMAREYRGGILANDVNVTHLEARQTILEGQFPLVSGVRKIPDIRRGEMVQVRLKSGDVILNTTGVAEEPAYLDGNIRVMTSKTKRELNGKLLPGAVVEVSL